MESPFECVLDARARLGECAVWSTDEQAQTPTGTYTGCLLTRDSSPLEPDLVELKWYAPGVGPVLTLTPSGEQIRCRAAQRADVNAARRP